MPPKKDAYSKRNNNSIPAPIEVDSDSDFAPGAYVPELKLKKKTKTSAASSSLIKRKRGSLSESADEKLGKPQKRHHIVAVNALLQYFGHELDQYSASEEEGEAHESDEDADEEDEDEDEDGSQDEDDGEALRRATASLMSGRNPSNTPLQKSSATTKPVLSKPGEPAVTKGKSPPPVDDLATESDSEPEPRSAAPQQVMTKPSPVVDDSATESGSEPEPQKTTAPQKATSKPCPAADDSVTESDSEPEPWRTAAPQKAAMKSSLATEDSVTESDSEPEPRRTKPPQKAKAKPTTPVDDSATESDSEPEPVLNNKHKLKPKPGFDLKPGQQYAPALVLDEETGTKIPAAINTYLRDYQREGVQFMWRQYKEGFGGLLGDDMGLVSKTIQVISFLSAIMHKDGLSTDKHRRANYVSRLQDSKSWHERKQLPKANAKWPTCLIIAPSTVVHNWEREFQMWGYFEVGIYTGTEENRKNVLHDFKLGRLDVVVTTFGHARRNIDLIDELPWSCIFIDEVHMVKNPTSKVAKAFHRFACRNRFGLTGTTIQNSYTEMWTILDWTNPGRLGTLKQWQGYVVKPLTKGQSAGASEEERARALLVAQILKLKLLPNFFLRRTKDIIKDQLPRKTDQVVFCPLTKRQIAAYKHLLNMEEVRNLLGRDDPCPCGSKKARKNCCHPFVPGVVFRFMSILIKLSNHLGLILPGPEDTAEQTARSRELARVAFPEGDIPKYGAAMMKPDYCGKWGVLEALLSEWRELDKTNKVLIFTKSVKLLTMLDFHLSTKSYKFLRLDGKTKQEDRMPMIDEFNHNPDVYIFLISTLAGGTGLNLTGANKVVIFDPNWNPAHDLQAMDRAFRFGQVRDVSVFRLLGAGSVEELIYARQIYKQQQMAIGYDASVQTRYFQGVQGDNANPGELFGLKNIFTLHEDTLATKQAIEKASLKQLDWAMANMAPEQKRANKQLLEAEAKVKDPDGMDFKGLGALLFDDAPPRVEEDTITKTLSAVGVKYSHLNDQILLPSRIEAERTKQSLQKVRQRRSVGGTSKSKGKAKADPPVPFKFDVPHRSNAERQAKKRQQEAEGSNAQLVKAQPTNAQPMKPQPTKVQPVEEPQPTKPQPSSKPQPKKVKRKRTPKPPLTPEEQMFARLKSRRRALLKLKVFDTPQEVADFAGMFVTLSAKEQEGMIRWLDEGASEGSGSSSSSDASASDS